MISLDGITDSMDMSLSKLREIVKIGKPALLQSMGSQRVFPNESTLCTHLHTNKCMHVHTHAHTHTHTLIN